MASLAIDNDVPINLEKIEPKARRKSAGNSSIQASNLRRKSTGNNSSIQIIQPTKAITPNYLRNSNGSCHDYCKYGIKRAFPVKPWRPPGPKQDKYVKIAMNEKSDKDHRAKKVLTRQPPKPNVLLHPKPFGTNAFSHQPSVKQTKTTLLKSSISIRISRNDACKDIRISKKSNFLPLNCSFLPQSSPKIPIAKIRITKSFPEKVSQSRIKNCVKKSEREKTSYENVPEKIIHVIEPEDESRNKILAQEGYNCTASVTPSSSQKNNSNSTAENRNRAITIRGARVVIPKENDDTLPKKLKFRRGKVLEIGNGNSGSIDKSLRRLVSDGKKFIHKKNDSTRGVLKHQAVERKNKNSVLLNTVIEERASKLVKIRKSKVKALVGAFESVIKIQDPESSITS